MPVERKCFSTFSSIFDRVFVSKFFKNTFQFHLHVPTSNLYLFLRRRAATRWTRPWSWATSRDGGCSWTDQWEERVTNGPIRGCYCHLSDVHHVVLVLEHRGLVVVDVQVVGGREDGNQRGETRGLALSVHSVARVLGLVCANDWKKVVLLKEITACCIAAMTSNGQLK